MVLAIHPGRFLVVCVLFGVLALWVLDADAAEAGSLTMVLSFVVTGPTEAAAREGLGVVLGGIADSHGDLGPVVGGVSVASQDGLYAASGNVTLAGAPGELVGLERSYGLADVLVVGDGWFGPVSSESVEGFGRTATSMMWVAVAAGAVGVGICGMAALVRSWGSVMVFGSLFGMISLASLVGYLENARYAV